MELEYITNLAKGVRLDPLEQLKNEILDPNCRYFAVYGEGRSLRAGELTAWQVKSLGKRISVFDTLAFPDYDSLISMQDKQRKMIMLLISGSGTTGSVVDTAKDLRKLSDKYKGKYLKLVAVTSHPEKDLGKYAHECIMIPGRTKDSVEKDWAARQVNPENPTMGDNFEEKALLHLHAMVLSAQTGYEIKDIVNAEVEELKKDLKDEIDSGNYDQVKHYLKRSRNAGVFCHGRRQSNCVAQMVANRMNHYGIKTYVLGETTTPGIWSCWGLIVDSIAWEILILHGP